MVAEGQACSAARSPARPQPWGQHSWAGAAQTRATPQPAAASRKNKRYIHRDPICWPRPEVRPCLNPLVYQCRASLGSPPVKPTPYSLPAMRGGFRWLFHRASIHLPMPQALRTVANATRETSLFQLVWVQTAAQTEHYRAQKQLHNLPRHQQNIQGLAKEATLRFLS